MMFRGASVHSALLGLVVQVTPSVSAGGIVLVLQQFPIVRLVVDQMVRDLVGRVLLRLAAPGAIVLQRVRQIL